LKLLEDHQKTTELSQRENLSTAPRDLVPPIIPTLTDADTTLFPSSSVSTLVAYSSPWIDSGSTNGVVANISRQVLNIEVAYANFCGVRSIIIPGPRGDEPNAVSLYARAIQEALPAAVRANLIIHMPMYREPGLEETADLLSAGPGSEGKPSGPSAGGDIDLFSAWDSWHTIRSVCDYSMRLYVALRIPYRMPDRALQDRWFSEPLHYLTFGPGTFQDNRTGHPSLSRSHQEMINAYLRLKNTPWLVLYDVGPQLDTAEIDNESAVEFPSLAEAKKVWKENRKPTHADVNDYVSYMRYLERQQAPYSHPLETPTLINFQDWLQSPLQPLSDNLESATYEMFEGDPVKYDLYEAAIATAMSEWQALHKPTSSSNPAELIVAVAGAGRGPLVTRVLRSAERTSTAIQLWALEKNQNAYVYLLRQNREAWDGKVTVVQTDMRAWPGPIRPGSQQPAKVDILVTELLGSFGDNELSPECIDGIQRHIARPHGISIPQSYTAHLSPIATPRLHADISSRAIGDPTAFQTPWVVRLYAHTLVSQHTPDHSRFQQAWEFVHPNPLLDMGTDNGLENGKSSGQSFRMSGGGRITGSSGANEHNARHCHLTFVCRSRGAMHGLAGYFEAVLYAPKDENRERVELSILPNQIDKKSKDMISWFPIFFPLKVRLVNITLGCRGIADQQP
jgi:type II protein arginine methyltransferase